MSQINNISQTTPLQKIVTEPVQKQIAPDAAPVRAIDRLELSGAGALLAAVAAECAAIHEATYETFVTYPLELSLPA